MRSFCKSEMQSIVKGEWKSALEETIYVFSDSASCLKNGSFDLLISNTQSGNYFLTTYNIIEENENMFIEIGNNKSCVKYIVMDSGNNEIHIENSDQGVLILKKL
ncbi:MAG TPA: hypothetical protein VMI12_03435 [Puia sp.]|nr:hypothetical protein [Puia sp.]